MSFGFSRGLEWWRDGHNVDGLRASYWNTFFRSLAFGMLGIYVPVFVYLKGLEVGDGWLFGVRWLLVYVILVRVVTMLAVFPAAKFIDVKGFRWSVLLASLISIGGFGSLVLVDRSIWWLLPAAVMTGLEIALYWIPRLSMNVSDGHKSNIGWEIGMRNLIDRGVAVLGPFAGGMIVSLWGFGVLFALGIVVLIMSTLPLFFMSKHEHKDGVKLSAFLKFIKKDRISALSFVGHGMSDVTVGWVWPLFVFVVVGGVRELGAVTSAVLVVSMLGVWVASRSFDRLRSLGGEEDEKMYVSANILTAVMMFIRGFARNIWMVFGLDLVYQVVFPLMVIPLHGYVYTLAEREGEVQVFSYREFLYSAGAVFASVLSIGLIGLAGGWQLVFMLGSLGLLVNIKMKKESNH